MYATPVVELGFLSLMLFSVPVAIGLGFAGWLRRRNALGLSQLLAAVNASE